MRYFLKKHLKLTNLKRVPSMFFIKKQPKLTNLKRVPTILFFKKQLKFLTKVLRNYLKNKGGGHLEGGVIWNESP